MSNVRGKIVIDVQFTDSTTSAGVQSLKTLTLQSANEYTSGKVAIVAGTVGTTQTVLWSVNDGVGFGGYKNADGSEAVIGLVTRFAVVSPASGGVTVEDIDALTGSVHSRNNELAVASNNGGNLQIRGQSSTASFVAILYGQT